MNFRRTVWWDDTAAWIERIPQELDSKAGAPPLKGWRVFEAETLAAARAAAWDAARAANAALAARADNAGWDGIWTDAWVAAWDAARAANAARAADAARVAAWVAAWDAARDAELLALVKVCAGLKLDPKHIRYAEERWEANRRGFRVLCDVNGVLYVYRKKGVFADE